MNDKISYIASPYTHKDEDVKEERAVAAAKACVFLMSIGRTAFSPIASCHYIEKIGGLSTVYNDWQILDEAILKVSDVFLILTLNGWKSSKGMKAEYKFFCLNHLYPLVEYMIPSADTYHFLHVSAYKDPFK